MQERGSEAGNQRRVKARAKAVAAPRRRKPGEVARAFDLVSLSVAIWLGVLVAAEGMQKLSEMPPDAGITTASQIVQQSAPVAPVH